MSDTQTARVAEGAVDSAESRITVHELLVKVNAGPEGLDILHRDLFDSRPPVVISALRAIAAVGHPSSARFAARLLAGVDPDVRLEAIGCLGRLKVPAGARLLVDLYKTTRDDATRCETLMALAEAAPDDPTLLTAVREHALSQLASDELRATAAVLYLTLAGTEKLHEVLADAPAAVVERILVSAGDGKELAGRIIEEGSAWYERFTPSNRRLLINLAAASPDSGSADVILHGLDDADTEARHAAYRALGRQPANVRRIAAFVEHLFDRFETTTSLEEQALAAVDRLDELLREQGAALELPSAAKLRIRTSELFKEVSAPVDRVGSDAVELGWLILHSRDYVEYYASEEFRDALVHYLKGGSYYTTDQLLAMLKSSADQVEVRHFEGYRALGEIIKNPQRPGMALVTRDLTIARLGKRVPFGRLIRNLKLLRLLPSVSPEMTALASQIYTWAKGEKLFRLAEAGLSVVARFAPQKANAVCRELLTPPMESKILTICAIHLASSFGAGSFSAEIEGLLRGKTDQVILLNLLDAMPGMGLAANPRLAKAALDLLRSGDDRELMRETGRFVASCSTPTIFENLISDFSNLEGWRQTIILEVIDRMVERLRSTNRDGLAEFLYTILRSGDERLAPDAAVMLWKLGDEFALKVIDRLLQDGDAAEKTRIVARLKGLVNQSLSTTILALVHIDHAGIHQAIRETLGEVTDGATLAAIRGRLIGDAGGGSDNDEYSDDEIHTPIVTEKQAYRFEHEFIQELAILFTDIQGYSRKAQALTSLQLSSLLHDYEGILLPTVSAHHGDLIKKMGDGHLFVFESALDAGLAAIRLQKALKRFNSYREESMRVVVRVGIHWGKVVRREGDVLGNHVNIASRLESSAKAGSILVSQRLFDRFDGRIHARELGQISVKNITDPIRVFEPYEIQMDLPDELDPLKTRGRKATSARPDAEASRGIPAAPHDHDPSKSGPPVRRIDPETLRLIGGVFSSLDNLCQKAERGEIEIGVLRIELRKGWSRLLRL